jgi:uncharacterized protein (TIGR03437 family)
MRKNNPLHWISIALVLLAVAGLYPVRAQQITTVAVRVYADQPTAQFWVDGTMYTNSANFQWPEGSKHTLEVRNTSQYNPTRTTRIAFRNWVDATGLTVTGNEPILTITADRRIPNYLASFGRQHRLDIVVNNEPLAYGFDDCFSPKPEIQPPPPTPPASTAGYVTVTGAECSCAFTTTYTWVTDGATIGVNAIPMPGITFESYSGHPALAVQPFGQFAMTGPFTVSASFSPGRRIVLQSAPVLGLRVLVDRNVVATRNPDGNCLPAPLTPSYPVPGPGNYPACTRVPICTGELDLKPGTEHILGAPEIQEDHLGNRWVFDHWEYGGPDQPGQNFVYKVPGQSGEPITVTAVFVRALTAQIFTEPQGLKLKVDGKDKTSPFYATWGLGQKHVVSVTPDQIDKNGRRYRFIGWSNEGSLEQEVQTSEEHIQAGFKLVALYERLGQLTIKSEPLSVTVNVGETQCQTPCTIDEAQGTEVLVSPVLEQELSADTRVEFNGWSDGEATADRPYTFTGEGKVLTLNYRVMHKLVLLSDPEDGVDYVLEPSPDPKSFFLAGTRVSITAKPKLGFKFRRWDGALAGTWPSSSLTMSKPLTVVARLDRIPALPEGAIKNAAGETPVDGVAPGSVISILGANLAPEYEKGPDSPLAQTLQGLTVHIGNRMLGLLWVSPSQISAVLPWDLPEGENTLTVRLPGNQPMPAKFNVYRNAPGLYLAPDNEQPIALALHEDGKPVAVDNPAAMGETLTLIGTGFGPYNPSPLEGFPVPDNSDMRLIDAAELIVEDQVLAVESITAVPGQYGLGAVKLKVTGEWPMGQNVQIRVRIRGNESNTVLIPMQ